jgi:hypothetical protein
MALLDENYGVADAKRSRVRWRIVLWGLLAVAVGVSLFFTFRNWREERTMNRFLALLREQKYQDAYALWDDPETRSSYPPEKFIADFGPSGEFANVGTAKIEIIDSCGDGVVFTLVFPGKPPLGLVVVRATNVIGFAQEARCPGKHWHLKEFLKSVFG